MNRQEYIESLKASALAMGKEAVLKAIAAKVPFFVTPIINPITALIVQKILKIFINETEFAAFFLYIDTRTSHQGELFSQMAYKNYLAQRNGTDEEKRIAEQNLISAFRNFARLDL